MVAPETVLIVSYDADGVREKETYGDRIVPGLSKVEQMALFMRGGLVGSAHTRFEVTTVNHINAEGAVWSTSQSSDTLLIDESDIQRSYSMPGYPVTPLSALRWAHGRRSGVSGMDQLEILLQGQIGAVIDTSILMMKSPRREYEVYINSQSKYVQHLDTIRFTPYHRCYLPLRFQIPTGEERGEISLSDMEGGQLQIIYKMYGYDLGSEDFAEDKQQMERIVLKDRSHLIVRSDGREKLLRLTYPDGETTPYRNSQMLTRINLKGFARGIYLLENIDLASAEVKYAQVELR